MGPKEGRRKLVALSGQLRVWRSHDPRKWMYAGQVIYCEGRNDCASSDMAKANPIGHCVCDKALFGMWETLKGAIRPRALIGH